MRRIFLRIGVLVALFFFLAPFSLLQATERNEKYALLFEEAYRLRYKDSPVLEDYLKLRAKDTEVILMPLKLWREKRLPEDWQIVLRPESFSTEEAYREFLQGIKETKKELSLTDTQDISGTEMTGYYPALDKFYPFSDFEKAMDLAESLHENGLSFILSFMPVYENYHLEAFTYYIQVLEYIQSLGGKLFIRFPLENRAGVYNLEPDIPFQKALEQFRSHGLEIEGITVPEDKLFSHYRVFQNLSLTTILVVAADEDLEKDADYYQASLELRNYSFIRGIYGYPDFSETAQSNQGRRAILLDLQNEIQLEELLRANKNKELILSTFKFPQVTRAVDELSIEPSPRPPLEPEKEEPEEIPAGGLNISRPVGIALRIAFLVFVFLAVQVILGRRLERKKYFK